MTIVSSQFFNDRDSGGGGTTRDRGKGGGD